MHGRAPSGLYKCPSVIPRRPLLKAKKKTHAGPQPQQGQMKVGRKRAGVAKEEETVRLMGRHGAARTRGKEKVYSRHAHVCAAAYKNKTAVHRKNKE